MPNRIIHAGILTSESLSQLTWFEQCVFFRILTLADDYGRYDARASIIRGQAFALYNVTDKQVEAALTSLGTAGIVDLYTVGGRPYLQLKTWDRYQQIRNHKSKFPAKSEAEQALREIDINCNQLISIDCNCPRNPIQSESESVSESKTPKPPKGVDARFDAFWRAYPKKVGKDAARKAFEKRKPDETLLAAMLSAIEKQRESSQWQKDGGQYIPNPATWLNGGRWMDEGVDTVDDGHEPDYIGGRVLQGGRPT